MYHVVLAIKFTKEMYKSTRGHSVLLFQMHQVMISIKKATWQNELEKKWDYIWDTMMKDTISKQSLQRLQL